MERDFYTDEFEDLIKLKSDQYRMYPSDKVWKGVRRSLHSGKRKYWFGFTLLLTGLSYFGIDQLIVSPPAKQNSQPSLAGSAAEKQTAKILPFDRLPSTGSLELKKPDLTASPDVEVSDLNNVSEDVTTVEIKSAVKPSFIVVTEKVNPASLPDIFGIATNPKLSTIVSRDKPVNIILMPDVINTEETTQEKDIQKINWLQEYAIYDLPLTKPQRVNWQLSFAPTMNYRRLTGRNNANLQSSSRNIPIALNIEGDLDKLVNHKPALGFELGSFLIYSVNHNLALKAGFQFNYSRYEIQAYSSATERATIALNSVNGLSSSSINNYTQLRNFGGYAVQDLQNQYFQVSVPMGIEVNLLGSNKLQLGVAGTIQPTYLLNRNTYLISSDYKNYTKEPSLVRRWNLNTSAETFVSYKTAGLKWQVGPQIRYQLFSSHTDKYPIKEYLIEYGVKIGVTKTIR